MMKCAQIQKALFSFLSGNLDYKTERELLGHLNHCSKCHEKCQQLQADHQMLESLSVEDDIPKAPVDFWQLLEHRLEQPAPRLGILTRFNEFVQQTVWIPKFRRMAVLSSLLLCLGLGLIGYRVFYNQIPNYSENGHVQKEIYLLENLMSYSEFDDVNLLEIPLSESNSFSPTIERYLLDETEEDTLENIHEESPLIEDVFYISAPSDKRIL